MPVVKKHFVLSVLTPPNASSVSTVSHGTTKGVKHEGLVSARWVEWLHHALLRDLQHPFVSEYAHRKM